MSLELFVQKAARESSQYLKNERVWKNDFTSTLEFFYAKIGLEKQLILVKLEDFENWPKWPLVKDYRFHKIASYYNSEEISQLLLSSKRNSLERFVKYFWVGMCLWDPGSLSLYQSYFSWILLLYTRTHLFFRSKNHATLFLVVTKNRPKWVLIWDTGFSLSSPYSNWFRRLGHVAD